MKRSTRVSAKSFDRTRANLEINLEQQLIQHQTLHGRISKAGSSRYFRIFDRKRESHRSALAPRMTSTMSALFVVAVGLSTPPVPSAMASISSPASGAFTARICGRTMTSLVFLSGGAHTGVNPRDVIDRWVLLVGTSEKHKNKTTPLDHLTSKTKITCYTSNTLMFLSLHASMTASRL